MYKYMEHSVGFEKKHILVIESPIVLYYDIMQELFNFSAAEVLIYSMLIGSKVEKIIIKS